MYRSLYFLIISYYLECVYGGYLLHRHFDVTIYLIVPQLKVRYVYLNKLQLETFWMSN